jgi:hypothetical protein
MSYFVLLMHSISLNFIERLCNIDSALQLDTGQIYISRHAEKSLPQHVMTDTILAGRCHPALGTTAVIPAAHLLSRSFSRIDFPAVVQHLS